MNTRIAGEKGEHKAVKYLQSNGYTIVARNFRNRKGEIDIIGIKDDLLIFFEVKSGKNTGIESLEYSLNQRKRGRIVSTSKDFLRQTSKYNGCKIRYDVLFVQDNKNDINHIENAFFEGGVA